ncbi:prepilin peptidase [Desulfolucanica intricata]|uniref:prepilin peptidase n=1 Tax=Desulfolucanica intricata TaxID=1285191 RepID=UPI0009EDF320|nr:A24 family peptidase [Desulfolucanica intricata]
MNIIALLVFIVGACVGSFLNVCIYRIPAGESVIYPPSHCTSCGKSLKVFDLIPLLSYILLRGKCRYCGVSVSRQYPLVELVTGLFYLTAFIFWGCSWKTPAMWVLFSILITSSVIDYFYQLIPNRVVLVGYVLGLPLISLHSLQLLKSGLLGSLAAGLFLLAIAVISRGGMGGGDIKLGALIGLYLGLYNTVIALFLAFLAGATAGLVLMLFGRKGRKDVVPFGPFLALGSVITVFWGEILVKWYWGLWL